jgi:[ribosomal protein S5]-alanine N-acetyltransferase
MTIQTDISHIIIDAINPEDGHQAIDILNNRSVSKFLISVPYPYSMTDFKKWLFLIDQSYSASGRPMNLAIRHSNFGFIGTIGYSCKYKKNSHCEDIGFWLAEEFWGKGIMTSVILSFLNYSFETYNFKRIGAHVQFDNFASKRVLTKCGFDFEGVLRNFHFKKGSATLVDAEIYSIIRL